MRPTVQPHIGYMSLAWECGLTGVTDASVKDLNADFMGFRGSDLNLLNGQWLAGGPGNGSLTFTNQHALTTAWVGRQRRHKSSSLPCT